ncbi:MAG: hypothetical protein QXH30_02340 [Candidatus Bilamarchaeaceae archaeon]
MFSLLLSGCVDLHKANEGGGSMGGTGSTGTQTGNTAGGSGGEVVVVGGTTSGGMSDPSKCRNLPPQQMADCLEQSMGD